MIFSNINLGVDVDIDPSTSLNNVTIGDRVKIAKRCSVFGSRDHILVIGSDSYVGMNSILNGFAEKLIIGSNVSIAQNVNIMVDSGPNASLLLQKIFPLIKGSVVIGNHCWIGSNSVIMPGVILGDFCIVAANSFINGSYPSFSVIGGSPSRLIRSLTNEEKEKLKEK